jgi:hypothetical protein
MHSAIGTDWVPPSVLAYVALAIGWLLAGLLVRPSAWVHMMGFAYWTLIAIQVAAANLQWDTSMGLRIAIKLWSDPNLSVDVVAAVAAAIFFGAWRQRRLTIIGAVRDAPV